MDKAAWDRFPGLDDNSGSVKENITMSGF